MEPLTLSTSVYCLLNDLEHNPEKPTQRDARDPTTVCAEQCRMWINMNVLVSDSLATLIVDYTFPTQKQQRFIDAYVDLVKYGNLKLCRRGAGDVLAIVRLAIMQDGRQLSHASSRLVKHKPLVLAAVKNGATLLDACRLCDDKDVVLAAVKRDGRELHYASDVLQNDKEVVLAAVRQYGQALSDASDELRNDKEVVLTAVKQDDWAYHFASDELRNDKDVMLAAVTRNPKAIQYGEIRALQNDPDILRAAGMSN